MVVSLNSRLDSNKEEEEKQHNYHVLRPGQGRGFRIRVYGACSGCRVSGLGFRVWEGSARL